MQTHNTARLKESTLSSPNEGFIAHLRAESKTRPSHSEQPIQVPDDSVIRQLKVCVSAFCKKQLFNQQDSDDFEQDVLEALLVNYRKTHFKTINDLDSFCYGVCKNIFYQLLRYKKKQRELTDCIQISFPDAQVYSPDYCEQLIQKQKLLACNQALESLAKERDKQVLLAHFVFETSNAEIAQDHDIKSEHVYRIVSRAKIRLRERCKNFM